MTYLTVAFHTCRDKPEFEWFFQSLEREIPNGESVDILLIDLRRETRTEHIPAIPNSLLPKVRTLDWRLPKPSVWQGKHRLTPKDCWDVSASRNSAICLCRTPWLWCLDDRAVIQPGAWGVLQEAMRGSYAVFGAYEKRVGTTVENGVIKHGGTVIGEDGREQHVKSIHATMPFRCPGEWSFGCNLMFPLDWALEINGYDERYCSFAAFEDCFFGLHLRNSGFDCRYDYRLRVVQDRTPSELGEPIFKRDKGVSPNDKSHEIVRRLKDLKQAPNRFNIREMRDSIQSGNPFPIPTEPTFDWWDQQPIGECS